MVCHQDEKILGRCVVDVYLVIVEHDLVLSCVPKEGQLEKVIVLFGDGYFYSSELKLL